MDKPPRGQTACWTYLCEDKPEICVVIKRQFPGRPIKVWMCRRCAGMPARVEPAMPLFGGIDP